MDNKMSKNGLLIRAQALFLVSLMIISGSIVMAPGVLGAGSSNGYEPLHTEPHGLIGYLYDSTGATLITTGVAVTILNPATGESITNDTDAAGQYTTDLQWLSTYGYEDGGTIYIYTEEPNQAFTSIIVDMALPFQQADLIVDLTDPVIGATTIDEPYINNQGTFLGTAPPVSIEVQDVTDDVALAGIAWGIRNDLQNPNGTIYFSCDITNEAMPVANDWNGECYFLDGKLVTASISLFNAPLGDLFVYGEVNGTSSTDDVIGNEMPRHYATFMSNGIYQAVYATNGTLDFSDDQPVTPVNGDYFQAFIYNEGDGYIVTASNTSFNVSPWLSDLTIADVPDGRYAVCVSAIDEAGNTAWTNETVNGSSNPVITVDNFAPDADANGPVYSDSYIFNVTYDYTLDPTPSSGLLNISLWYSDDGGGSWTFYGEDPSVGDDEIMVDLTALGGGTYDWYMTAYDNTLNHEIAMYVIEASTLVDAADPVIGATTVDKLYINNDPINTFGGTPPPVEVAVASITEANLLVAAWGIRDEFQAPNPTLYFVYDITDDVTAAHDWDGNQYFIDGNIVTVTMSNIFGLDMIVYGELDGGNVTDFEIGNNMPSYYAVFSSIDMSVTMYATHNSTNQLDHEGPLALSGGEVFNPYRYDEGDGYIVTGANSTYTLGDDYWIPLDPQPVPEGRYAVCVSAIDEAGNTAWTNETVNGSSNPVITVDNFAPDADATGPAISNISIFNVTYTWIADPNPSSGLLNISLWYKLDGAGWVWYAEDPSPGNGIFPVNLTLLGDGTYQWFMAGFDMTKNHEDLTFLAEFTTIVDTVYPYVASTDPANEAVAVSLSLGTYDIEFNEVMAGVGIPTTDLPGIAWVWSANGMWLNGTYGLLTESTIYTVDLNTSTFEDIIGNPLVEGANGWTFNFTTEGINPEVVSTDPIDTDFDIALAPGTYSIEFNEPMDTVSAFTVTTGLPGIAWVWSANGMWLNGTYALLTESQTYTVDLNGGGFTDDSGNALIAGTNGWTFTFDTVDISPEVFITDPANGTTDVGLAPGTYAINFNEPMDTVSAFTVTTDLLGITWTWSVNGMWLNGTYALLTESQTYTIDLTGGGFQDIYGNPLVAGTYGLTLTFDTGDFPPSILTTAPVDGAAGVALTTDIVISFTEEMNPASFAYTIVPNPGGWTETWNSPVNTQVTLTHADFNEFMEYTVTVTVAEDIWGNTIVAGAVPNPWAFTTLGTFSLSLDEGWNLLGIPVLSPTVGGTPINNAADLGDLNAVMITKWDFTSQRYINYIPGFHTPANPQNFAIEEGQAYWVWMSSADTIDIVGGYPGARSLNVDGPGWNMISYMNPVTIGDVETDWADDVTCGGVGVDDIAYYDAGNFIHYLVLGDNVDLIPGKGYFVWSDAPAIIDYGAAPPGPIANTNGGDFNTIQAAINAASPGDTLELLPGVYTEDLLIDEEVKITAMGAVTIEGSHTITASNVILDPITFETTGTAITIDATGGAIDNVQFLDCIFNLPSPSVAIFIGSPASANLISNVMVDNCVFNGPSDKVSNVIKIGGAYGGPASQPVSDFTFQNNEVYNASMNYNLQDADFTNFVFDNNLFRYTDGLMYFWGEGVKGTLTGQLNGFSFINNDANESNTYGIGFDHDPAFFGVQTYTDVYVDANFNFAAMEIHNNSFDNIVGNYGFDGAVFIVSSGITGDIDARWNWWGDTTGPYHAVDNTGGLGGEVSDHILFDPWWTDSAMTTENPQTVITNQGTGTTYPTIQAAVVDAISGATIILSDGIFTESLVIDKPLTLQGAGNGYSSSGSGNQIYSLPSSSIIDGGGGQYGIKITSDNVIVSGFKIVNAHYGILVENIATSQNNVEISYNTFEGCDYGVRMYAYTIGNVDFANIHDNVFLNNRDYAIYLGYVYNSIITNNDFVDNAPGSYQCVNPAPSAPTPNQWVGNFWSDWAGPGATPYNSLCCVKNAQDLSPSPVPFHYV